ncbi:hypothetical protein [Fimbriiglobus ruber]|uniref:Uncharacterized protein n=1 Tax=Fimbriiglobus ruber TaxID=1908690 RepID=A0A225D8J7_9BACT|nr:hypothetical protein [Fimbriiglobus ruber]OWK35954.1 hypothetical protein FRUB_08517 [Fimbriiglobus ruber]
MAIPTILISVLLIAVGLYGYLNGTPGSDGKISPTALIPAAFGAVLLLCGLLSLSDKLRKHVMHFAAMVGLLGIVSGFVPLQRQLSKTGEIDVTKPSAVAGIAMSVLCLVFVVLCVNSFIQARKARKLREQSAA